MSMTASSESSHSPVSCGSMSGSECTKPSMNTSPGYGALRLPGSYLVGKLCPGVSPLEGWRIGHISRARVTQLGEVEPRSAVFEELGHRSGDAGAVEAEVGEQRGGLAVRD